MGSYYALKGHHASSHRGIALVESTQINWFSRRSGGGGLKGLSEYHSSETAIEAARREASGPDKRATFTNIYSKERAEQQL
jgi:hypothetical protein